MPPKEKWSQESYLPPVHRDIGETPPSKHKRPHKQENPDVAAVFNFLRRETAAIYTEDFREAVPPDFNELTRHQQQIYRAIKSGEEHKAAASKQQWEANRSGLAEDAFYLDQIVALERACGRYGCNTYLVREAVLEKAGKDTSRLLVNEYCPSCGFTETGREFHFSVSNSQIVKRE